MGQEMVGTLVHNDGTAKEKYFLNLYRKSNYDAILYLHYGMPQELYAKYFKRVSSGDDIVYTTIKMDEDSEKVWARLQFESKDIKLHQHRKRFFIECGDVLTEITKNQNLDDLHIPNDLKLEWEEKLKSSPKLNLSKVKKLLEKFHKKKGTEFDTYFNTPAYIPYLEAGIGAGINKGNLLISRTEKTDFTSISPGIYMNTRLYMPRVLKQSFVSAGVMIQRFNIHKDISTEGGDNENFHELDINFIRVAVPISFNLSLFSKHEIDFYLSGGAKMYMNLGGDGDLVTEVQENKVVRTEIKKLELAKKSGFAPLIGLVANKKFGKTEMSFLLQYEKNMESGSASDEKGQIEFSNSAFTIGAAIKF
jgi:hypothetical protein